MSSRGYTYGLILLLDSALGSEGETLAALHARKWEALSFALFQLKDAHWLDGGVAKSKDLIGRRVSCRIHPNERTRDGSPTVEKASAVVVEHERRVKVSVPTQVQLEMKGFVPVPWKHRPKGSKRGRKRPLGMRSGSKWANRSNWAKPGNVFKPFQGGGGG